MIRHSFYTYVKQCKRVAHHSPISHNCLERAEHDLTIEAIGIHSIMYSMDSGDSSSKRVGD